MTPKELQHSHERTAFRAELLVGAEEALSLMMRMNSYGPPLDHGFSPSTLGNYGGYWLAQEALVQILTEYLGGDRPKAERVMADIGESGESVTSILLQRALHHGQRGVLFAADVITLDGSDTTCDGEPCEPGQGYDRVSGWVDPNWSWSEVSDDRHDTSPVVWTQTPFDPEDPSSDPVLWLVDLINAELGGIEEGSDGGSMYSPGEKTFDDDTVTVRASAHPFGFSAEELTRALEILNGPKSA